MMTALQPYAGLAGIYDRIMNHVRYDDWAAFAGRVFERYDCPVRKVIEIACGTGSLSRELSRLGYQVTAVDRSVPMLQVAADKFRYAGMPLRLVAADMTALPLQDTVDAVICLYDSVNYLHNDSQFSAFLAESARLLRPGGLLVFDVCTVTNSQLYFSSGTTTEQFGTVTCRRSCRYYTRERIQENRFEVDDMGRKWTEVHRQRIYLLREIDDLIAGQPLRLLGKFDDMSFRRGTEDSERVHYVLERM